MEQVKVDDIHQLPAELVTLPAQAVHCSLAGVKPKEKLWSTGKTKNNGNYSFLASWNRFWLPTVI